MPAHPVRQADPRFTWDNYHTWPESERWELIDGVAYAMSPAPSTKHQTVAGNIFGRLLQGLSGKPCRPFIAPTDMHLSDLDVVQPDILVVCKPGQITPSHIEGAPDVVVEVLTPATATRDLREEENPLRASRCGGIHGGQPASALRHPLLEQHRWFR